MEWVGGSWLGWRKTAGDWYLWWALAMCFLGSSVGEESYSQWLHLFCDRNDWVGGSWCMTAGDWYLQWALAMCFLRLYVGEESYSHWLYFLCVTDFIGWVDLRSTGPWCNSIGDWYIAFRSNVWYKSINLQSTDWWEKQLLPTYLLIKHDQTWLNVCFLDSPELSGACSQETH